MPMGTGKTSGMIKYINTHPHEKYMFITPFISEIKRVIENCPLLNFHQPEDNNFGKLADIKNLIANGENIASTHALFYLFDKSIINLIQKSGYILILDEVLEIIEPIKISKKDMHMLTHDNIIFIDENNTLSAIDKTYRGVENKFNREIQTIKNHHVIIQKSTISNIDKEYKDIDKNAPILCLFNSNIFKCFSDIFVLTYLFEGSIMQSYFKLFDLQWDYFYINNYKIYTGKYNDYDFKVTANNLINLYNGNLNKIGDNYGALSATWFKNIKKQKEHIVLKNNMHNYFRNIVKSNCNKPAWSTITGYNDRIKDKFAPKGFTKNCFIPCNARATNRYSHKTDLIYALNVYPNPLIFTYLIQNNIYLDKNAYALSQLIQWIWRSAIRNNQPINLYLPSARMREIFLGYLNVNDELAKSDG